MNAFTSLEVGVATPTFLDALNPLSKFLNLPLSFVVFKRPWEIPDEFHRYPYLPVTHCAQQADMGYL